MEHSPINQSKEPIRLFKSDFMEFFTHIHPAVIVIVWLPVAVFFMVRAAINKAPDGSWWFIPVGFLAGLFLWTLAEYLLHRFLFHFPARTPRQERILFLFHGIHHAQPQVKTRLVMPLPVSIPLALVFFGLFWLVLDVALGIGWFLGPAFSGFLVGYLIYDLMHYAEHHFAMRRGVFKAIKRYHMQHHYKTPNQRFGVSSPLWDYVFGTQV